MGDIPIGFSMALAENPKAMQAFGRLSIEEQQKIISHAHTLHSKRSMHDFVNGLENRTF